MRGVVMRLLALAFACVVALAMMEGLLRVLDLAPSEGVGSVDEADFARVPGILTPDQDLVDREKPMLPYHVHIDSLGYRGTDFSVHKPAGSLRVLAVGDSFTYGDFVDDDETLPARLEALLRTRCGDVTVVNAGVGGTTLVTHEQMIRRALPLEPDVVLLTFSENDVVDLAAPMWVSLESNRRAKSRFPLSILYPVLRQTALWNFGLRVRATWATQQRPVDAAASEPTPEQRAAQQQTMQRLRDEYVRRLTRIRDLLDERGIPLVYVLYPTHHSVLALDDAEQMAWVASVGASLGLTTVDLLGPLRASAEPMERLYLLPHDGHPSPLGYRIAARAVLDAVAWPAPCGARPHGTAPGVGEREDGARGTTSAPGAIRTTQQRVPCPPSAHPGAHA